MKAFKDHFGIATSKMEKSLRTEEAISRFSNEIHIETLPIPEQNEVLLVNEESFQTNQKRLNAKVNEVKFGNLDRESYLANKYNIEHNIKPEKTSSPSKSQRTPRISTPAPIIEILSATYGIPGETMNVTNKIIIGEKFTNITAGSDPCPRKKKQITILATIDGIEKEFVFIENKRIQF